MNGVCLGIKSNKYYSEINFKFKVINYKNTFFGVILLKLDNDSELSEIIETDLTSIEKEISDFELFTLLMVD